MDGAAGVSPSTAMWTISGACASTASCTARCSVTDAARQALVAQGYDPVYGARPLKRLLQHAISDPLALALLDGRFADGDTIVVDAKDGEIVLL